MVTVMFKNGRLLEIDGDVSVTVPTNNTGILKMSWSIESGKILDIQLSEICLVIQNGKSLKVV